MSIAIHIDNIRKTIGTRDILKGITFDVETGDIFGYLGPNGAGKTTTIRISSRPAAGRLRETGYSRSEYRLCRYPHEDWIFPRPGWTLRHDDRQLKT